MILATRGKKMCTFIASYIRLHAGAAISPTADPHLPHSLFSGIFMPARLSQGVRGSSKRNHGLLSFRLHVTRAPRKTQSGGSEASSREKFNKGNLALSRARPRAAPSSSSSSLLVPRTFAALGKTLAYPLSRILSSSGLGL